MVSNEIQQIHHLIQELMTNKQHTGALIWIQIHFLRMTMLQSQTQESGQRKMIYLTFLKWKKTWLMSGGCMMMVVWLLFCHTFCLKQVNIKSVNSEYLLLLRRMKMLIWLRWSKKLNFYVFFFILKSYH